MRQLKITKQVTNRETASLDKYLQEIGKVDLITADEEVELAQRIKAGDQIALEKLTKANLRFVVSVAKQYQNQGLTLPDLINEGKNIQKKIAEELKKNNQTETKSKENKRQLFNTKAYKLNDEISNDVMLNDKTLNNSGQELTRELTREEIRKARLSKLSKLN